MRLLRLIAAAGAVLNTPLLLALVYLALKILQYQRRILRALVVAPAQISPTDTLPGTSPPNAVEVTALTPILRTPETTLHCEIADVTSPQMPPSMLTSNMSLATPDFPPSIVNREVTFSTSLTVIPAMGKDVEAGSQPEPGLDDVAIDAAVAAQNRIVALLQSVKQLAEVDLPFLERFARPLHIFSVNAGEFVVRQGDYGDTMWFVVAGEVDVFVDGQYVRTLAEGTYFGEHAVMYGAVRNASCMTKGPCELMEVGREQFLAAMEERPMIKKEFIQTILTREEDARYTDEERAKPQVVNMIHDVVEEKMQKLAEQCPLMAACAAQDGDAATDAAAELPKCKAVNVTDSVPSNSSDTSSRKSSFLESGSAVASVRRIGQLHPQHEGQAVTWQKRKMIGKGGFGAVYSAVNTSTGQPIAVKIIPLGGKATKSLLRAVRQESELIQSLQHPNVVRGLGLQLDTRNVYVLMELLKSGSLDQVLEDIGPLPESVVRSYTIQILEGLSYLHGKGILHRDIKPGNLLLSENGTVKLADFGISRLVSTAQSVVQSASIAGTPAYLSPEAIGGRYSISSDLWAVGCTVLQLITGKVPYADKGFEGPMQLIFYLHSTKSPPQIPPASIDANPIEGEVSSLLSDFLKTTFSARTTGELRSHPWLTAQNGVLPVTSMFSNGSSSCHPSTSESDSEFTVESRVTDRSSK